MPKCRNCSAIIPNGRNFCDAHYQEALQQYKEKEEKHRDKLQKYEEALAKYHQDIDVWNNLTPAQRAEADKKAEESSVNLFKGIFSAIVAVISGFYFKSWLVFIGAAVLIWLGLNALSDSYSKKIAKFLRAFIYGIGYTVVFVIIMKFFGVLDPTTSTFMKIVQIIVIIAPMILSFFLELTGRHHASGAPRKPSKPSQFPNRKPSP